MKKRVDKNIKDKTTEKGIPAKEEPTKTADDYECSGNLEVDFQELCALMGMMEMPVVTSSSTEKGVMAKTTWSPKPRLQIELDSDDPRSVKEVRIAGWKVDEQVSQVLSKALPSLSNLQNLHLWRTGLTESSLTCFRNTMLLCSNLRTVVLEGNPIPQQSYHLLMGGDSMITHLSLRNNCIGEEGARLIGSALSTTQSANKNLLMLNLAFNSVGNDGATHIAKGLRMNHTLLCLSLANNHIGDEGGVRLAEVLNPFPLTHEEIIEMRQLLIRREHSAPGGADSKCENSLSVASSGSLDRNISKGSVSASRKKEVPKKEEKAGGAAGKREDPKNSKKALASDIKAARGRGGKSGGKDKRSSVSDQEEKTSTVQKAAEQSESMSPLLDPGVKHMGGKVIMPGNMTLKSLNLAGNKLTNQSLPLFLSAMEEQGEGGLLRLALHRNRFSPDSDTFVKIQEMMSRKDPLNKSGLGQAV